MGLRCLFGHDFGEPELEREREEDGDEMIVTVREVKTCGRCGEQQVVSENKEVTTIRDPSDVGLDERGADAAPGDADAAGDTDDATPEAAEATDAGAGDEPTGSDPAGEDAAGDDAEIIDAEADADADADDASSDGLDPAEAAELVESAEPANASAPEAADEEGVTAEAAGDDDFEPPESAEEDDGVILDDGPEDPGGRAHGEWPDADHTAGGSSDAPDGPSLADVGGDVSTEQEDDAPVENDAEFIENESDAGAAQTAWPDQEGEDEGYDAEPGGDDVEVSFGGGLTPEVNGEVDAAGEEVLEGDATGFVRADSPSVDRRRDPNVQTEFYCPNCGESKVAGESSMRAGDICPSCRRGYIAERDL